MKSAVADSTTETVERKTFYSKAGGLCISVNKGKRIEIDGEWKRVDEKVVEFQPQPDNYGVYTTEDPEIIAYLEHRAETVKDVLTPAGYTDATTRPEDKIRALREENDRQLAENNRLLAMLREKGKLPA